MPVRLKQILVMQQWQHHLSHEIYHGVLDYVAHHARGRFSCSRFPWDLPAWNRKALVGRWMRLWPR